MSVLGRTIVKHTISRKPTMSCSYRIESVDLEWIEIRLGNERTCYRTV